jgi:methylase of polypeptide subunit release factors
MCQQSLIHYLFTELNGGTVSYERFGDSNLDIFGNEMKKGQLDFPIEHKSLPAIREEDIDTFIRLSEQFRENDEIALMKEEQIKNGNQKSSTIKPLLPESIRKNALLIDEKLKNITICDPAVGSGAFPVGMMNEIVKARTALNPYIKDDSRTMYNFKRECIEKSLYGVDIDPGAVEIAKLRLWLSLIVEEEDFKEIRPLPNLDYKIVCGNSLLDYPIRPRGFDKIEVLKNKFFGETNPNEKKIYRNQIDKAIHDLFNNSEKSLGYKVNFDFKINFSEVFHEENDKNGFNIVIANPPYVSTKGRSSTDKKALKQIFGFADDLYSHFYFKGIGIIKETGILCYISSRTFWTIQTKKNLRELFLKNRIIEIFDAGNPFDAMVDTCVIIVQKIKRNYDYILNVLDGKNNFLNPEVYQVRSSIYQNASNHVFFIPHGLNMRIYQKYNKRVKGLMDQWWEKICTSKKIRENSEELSRYRETLKEGDLTLLGLITDGGQGLATADNGRFVGVLENTGMAKNIEKTRPAKLTEAILSNNIREFNFIKNKEDVIHFLNSKNEMEIREIFDNLKAKYGRDIFGQGYLYKIISKQEIADVDSLSEEEKKSGIANSKPHFVPYDKGDKEGNRWYLETPFYIDWSIDAVKIYKTNPKCRWQGYDFYFREGFCWTDVNSIYLKCRKKVKGVYDVLSMSLFSMTEKVPEYYLISLINSKFMSEYVNDFLNNTSHFQINDARQLPIIVPDQKQLSEFKKLFDEAVEVKKNQFSNQLTKKESTLSLNRIQKQLDKMVYNLYGLDI